MKCIKYLVFLLFVNSSILAQNCGVFLPDLVDYEYEISDFGNDLFVTLNVDLTKGLDYADETGSVDIFYYYEGKLIYSELEIDVSINSKSYIHTIDLSNNSLVSQNVFTAHYKVEVFYYTGVSYVSTAPENKCFYNDAPLEIEDGSVFLRTVNSFHKKGDEVELQCMFSQIIPKEIAYELIIKKPNGTIVTSETDYISRYENNKYITIKKFTASETGVYTASISTDYSDDVIDIVVDNDGPTTINDDDITFSYSVNYDYDSASVTIKSKYSGEYIYYLQQIGDVSSSGCDDNSCGLCLDRYGVYHTLTAKVKRELWEYGVSCSHSVYNCKYINGATTGRWESSRMDSYETMVYIRPFQFNDALERIKTVPAIPDDDYIGSINLYDNSCKSAVWKSSTGLNKDLEWLGDVSVTNAIEFSPKPNFTGSERTVEFKVFLDENSEFLSEENGKKLDYRLITIKQPTAITKVNPATEETFALPDVSSWDNYDASKGDVYYVKVSNLAENKAIYIKDINSTPLQATLNVSDTEPLVYSGWRNGKSIAYNEKNEQIASIDFLLYNSDCGEGYSMGEDLMLYVDYLGHIWHLIVIVNAEKKASLENMEIKNGSLIVNAGTSIDIDNHFRANARDNGIYFRARIKPCSVLKSADEALQTTAEQEQTAQESILTDHVEVIGDSLQENTVNVYPIPTKGKLTVELKNVDEPLSGFIEVYSISGKKVSVFTIKELTTEIDISKQKPGNYIIRIYYNGYEDEWRVVTE